MRLAGQELECVRGGRKIFSGLDFAVPTGQALAVTGINGAGKSSLLRLDAGLQPAASGTVTLEGGETELTMPEQAHYLGHRDALKPALTVLENLDFWRDFLGGQAIEGLAALETVGLGHAAQLPAAFLSAGQRRRLSIARLIAVNRPVWLLDEPTSALDTSGQAMIAGLMDAHLRSGGIILAATHGPLGIAAKELQIGSDA
jgi:heme exporter protein A